VNGRVVNGRHRALFADGGEMPTAPEQDREPPFPVRAVRGFLRPRSIKAKLGRILLVSLVLVLAALGSMVASPLSSYQDAAGTSRIVTVALGVQDAVHQLQKERGLTNGLLGGGQRFAAQLASQRLSTDAALAALNKIINSPAYADSTASQVDAALGPLAQLSILRKSVDTRQAQATPTFAFYTQAIGTLNGLDLGLDQAQDAALRHRLQALYALADAKEYTAQERGLLNGVFAGAPFPLDQYLHFTEIRANKQNALALYDHFATPSERQDVVVVLHSPAATEAATFEAIAVAGVNGSLPQHVDAQAWWDQMTSVINDMRTVQQTVGVDITVRAQRLQNLALRELIAFLVAAAIAAGVEFALVIGASRSIIGPLGVLAADADDVSARRLPEAVAALENATDDEVEIPRPPPLSVPGHAGTEIRRVARALSRLQEAALSLAVEQATIRRNTTASLANLGRRNQNLVRRQLSLISEFEREELDPAALANMFELDHLATRMRRNAESLLVLVGESGPRPWSKPLPIVDVIRASLSEVADYRRVLLKRIDGVYIAGAVVTEVAHMLAELLENGLAFSPPDVEVEIHGRKVGDRYTIAVVDHGSGMQPDALVRANARLHDEENYLVAPTRFLGHYVVGRLARQLGAEVTLVPAPITGITARLVLPPELLVDPAGQPCDAPAGSAPESQPESQPEQEPTLAQASPTQPVRTLSGMTDVVAARMSHSVTATQPLTPAPLQNQRVRVDVRGERERTRNGLVKRQARTVRSRPALATRPLTAYNRPVPEAPASDRSPGDVGAMLSSYRAGHQRGEQDAAETTSTAPPMTEPSADSVAEPVAESIPEPATESVTEPVTEHASQGGQS
jgi:signal transduction histidine kinase